MGAAVMKKEACATFGRPVEELRNDPAKFLTRGAQERARQEQEKASNKKKKAGPFAYPGER